MRYVFFLSAETRFKGAKITPKVCTQKSFFLNISKNNYIFLVKPTPKYFLYKGRRVQNFIRVQNFCFEGLHPPFFSNINIFF